MPGGERYRTYDQFAWYYSKGWGEEYHEQARTVLETHVFPRLPPAARVLDLCCGSGDLSAALHERGYRVTGLDGSEEMLHFARQRLPETEFILADARAFHLEPSFHAALSTFDSLNHILSIEDLEAAFRNVNRALLPGGLFVFDLNMRESFETLWSGYTTIVEETSVGITRGSYDPATMLGRADITVFRREGELWRRSDAVVMERCYSAGEVRCALGRAGFIRAVCQEAGEVGMRGHIAMGRSFFFAHKPGTPAE